jgi:3-methyladenine DNA glycosylase/8-oxoguanine DNA glycosylase
VLGEGLVWATGTPVGPGTLLLEPVAGEVLATAWGPGASWLLERVPRLLGEDDDWTALDLSAYPALNEVLRGLPGLRLASTGRVLEALVPAVLEQRVTGTEAHRSWRNLLYRFGTPAPGPIDGLRIPPAAETLLQIPTWDWHRMGVEAARQRPIRAAATVAARMEECVSLAPDAALARLRVLPGVGEWTAAETVQRALGHPDAVSVGDYHLHDLVVFALTGRPRGDDAEMLTLLAPYAGQRQRVVRLIELSGARKPKFGPRYSPLDFRAM